MSSSSISSSSTSSPIRNTVLALSILYTLDFVCILFLPSSNNANYFQDFTLRTGTADLWATFLVRSIFCVAAALYVYIKTFILIPAAKKKNDEQERIENANNNNEKKGYHSINHSETTPLLLNNDNNDDDNKHREENEENKEIATTRKQIADIKNLDQLQAKWKKRSDYNFILTFLFSIEFLIHVSSNIYIAIKSLEYKYDDSYASPPSNNNSSGNSDNTTNVATTTFASSTSATLVSSIITTIFSTTTAPMTTSVTSDPREFDHHLTSPPPTWVAILISLLLLWCTLQLYGLHFYFSAIKKTKEAEWDVPAVSLIHPHQLIYEFKTVMSRCNVCYLRFKPRERKFRCDTCDFYVCSTCVDTKMQQWLDKQVADERDKPHNTNNNREVIPSATSIETTNSHRQNQQAEPKSEYISVIVGAGDKVVHKTLTKSQLLREIFAITEGFRPTLLLGMSALFAGTAISVFVPRLQGQVIDAIIGRDMHEVKMDLFLFAGLGIARLTLSSLRVYATLFATRLATNSIRTRVFTRILNRDMGFFDATATGVLQSRLTQDTNSMISPLPTLVNQVLSNIAVLIGASIMSFSVSWQLALLSFSVLGPIIFLTGVYAEFSRIWHRQLGDQIADSTNAANQTFSNIRTVQSFGTEPIEAKKYAKAMAETIPIARINSIFSAGVVFVNSSLDLCVWALTLGFGGYIVLNHPEQLTIGQLITFQLYINMLNTAYRTLSDSVNVLTKASGAAERVFTIMSGNSDAGGLRDENDPELFKPVSAEDEEKDDHDDDDVAESKNKIKVSNGDQDITTSTSSACYIKFEDVFFSYPTRPAAQVLKGLSIVFRPGEIVALCSASGHGKSTVLALLLMFYKISSGQILVGYPNAEKFSKAKALMNQHNKQQRQRKNEAASTSFSPENSLRDDDDDDDEKRKSGGMRSQEPSTSSTAETNSRQASLNFQAENIDNNHNNININSSAVDFDETNYDFTSLYEMNRRHWLRGVAVVSQETQLFNTTILDNVCYGTPDEILYAPHKNPFKTLTQKERDDIKLEKVTQVCVAALAQEFIVKLPDGYQTLVGDIGKSLLSGGQRQRLAIARALLRKPNLLILDEATSALDADSEAKVQETLEKILLDNKKSQNPMTCIIIAHRLSTIQNADRIIVLKEGVKIQEGNHASLMKETEGLYAGFVAKGFPKPVEKGESNNNNNNANEKDNKKKGNKDGGSKKSGGGKGNGNDNEGGGGGERVYLE